MNSHSNSHIFKALIIILPVVFTAQACNFLFGDIYQDQGSGPYGIFFSTDSGETWQQAKASSPKLELASAKISSFFIEPANPGNLLAASRDRGLLASDSYGQEWLVLLPNFASFEALISPANSEEIFTGGSRNGLPVIMKSTDRGSTWTEVYNQPTREAVVTSLAFDPQSGGVLYAGLSSGLLLKSTDAGSTWSALRDLEERIVRVAVLSDSGHSLYVLTATEGLSRSLDSGKTWASLTLPHPPSQFNDLSLDPGSASTLYLATDKGLFRSQNSGNSWVELRLPVKSKASNIATAAINPKNSKQIFAAIRSAIYRSDDGGITWRTALLPTRRIISGIIIDPEEPNRIYAGLR